MYFTVFAKISHIFLFYLRVSGFIMSVGRDFAAGEICCPNGIPHLLVYLWKVGSKTFSFILCISFSLCRYRMKGHDYFSSMTLIAALFITLGFNIWCGEMTRRWVPEIFRLYPWMSLFDFLKPTYVWWWTSLWDRIQASLKNHKGATYVKEWPAHSSPPKKYRIKTTILSA